MANEPKTRPTDASVEEFLDGVANAQRRQDGLRVLGIMREVTDLPGEMWGTAIIGFGRNHYLNAAGKPQEWPIIGFSPRSAATTIYLMDGFEEYTDLLGRLGKHTIGRSCLYIKKLADVDEGVLAALLTKSFERELPPSEG